jgi:hypothetical protein
MMAREQWSRNRAIRMSDLTAHGWDWDDTPWDDFRYDPENHARWEVEQSARRKRDGYYERRVKATCGVCGNGSICRTGPDGRVISPRTSDGKEIYECAYQRCGRRWYWTVDRDGREKRVYLARDVPTFGRPVVTVTRSPSPAPVAPSPPLLPAWERPPPWPACPHGNHDVRPIPAWARDESRPERWYCRVHGLV